MHPKKLEILKTKSWTTINVYLKSYLSRYGMLVVSLSDSKGFILNSTRTNKLTARWPDHINLSYLKKIFSRNYFRKL